jgi:hypothetical protein
MLQLQTLARKGWLVHALLLTASCLKAHSSLNSQGMVCARVASSTLGILGLSWPTSLRAHLLVLPSARVKKTNTSKQHKHILEIMLALTQCYMLYWQKLELHSSSSGAPEAVMHV